jgi:probable phosphoglycerate mutase
VKLFFVRHGETVLNAKNIHQYPDTRLSKNGLRQAALLGKRLAQVKPEVIVSSKYMRAMQTARAISKATGAGITCSILLNDFRNPSEVIGISLKSELSKRVTTERLKRMEDSEYHYSDEENCLEFRDRVSRALSMLKRRSESSIVVVTHEDVIKMVLSVLLAGNDVPMRLSWSIADSIEVKNTGITECKIDKKGRTSILTMNDYAHLR